MFNLSTNAIHANLRLRWPGFALEVALTLPGRGVTALFGASGSGKTTVLRCIAGLERAPEGHVSVAGEVWQDAGFWLPTHRRALGYVFQEASLLAHLTVLGNLRYGLRRVPGASSDQLTQAIELLALEPLLERRPERLSGGERQRVAIARALALKPRLLLMDEPLAALDAARKQEVLPYLERLQRECALPVLYVTHDIDEVARLAEHLVLLEAGQVRASGATADLLTRLDLPLAHTDSASAVLHACVLHHEADDHLTRVSFAGGGLWLPRQPQSPGQTLRLRVQARDVSLTLQRQSDTSILNIVPVNVTALAPDGAAQMLVALEAGGVALLARVTLRSARLLGLAPGLALFAQIKGVAILG